MATTTNYSWTTPDDTALVKDGAAAIRTLGSSVDTTVKNLNPETTLGDISYRSSTANVNTRLALGTANQQLRVNSGATAPEWFTPTAAGGMVLISTTTLSGSSVSLTSIPQTYKSLYVVIRNPRPVQDNVGFISTLNNDTGTKYKDLRVFSSNNQTASATSMFLSGTNMDNGASEGLITMLINDYTNTVTRKIVQIVAVMNNNTTLANLDFTLTYSIYFDNGAISRIDLLPEGVSGWTSGTALLYGVS